MPDMNADMMLELAGSMEIDLPEKPSFDQFHESLVSHINHLIDTNFEKLVLLLYHIDVSEPKLKSMLKEHPQEDAGTIIADLIIQRQLQKIKYRELFRQQGNEIDEDEKW